MSVNVIGARSSAVAARNASWSQRLNVLVATHARGVAPLQPTSAAASTTRSAAALSAKPISAAKLVQQFAFTAPNPKSTASKIAKIAAMNFAAGFSQRSISSTATVLPAPVPTTPPAAAAAGEPAPVETPLTFEAALGDKGAAAIVASLVEYATASTFGGFTWLVLNHTSRKIEVLNTPRNVCPLTLGMTPLLALDITPEAVLRVPSDDQPQSSPAAPPAWSRAARNKSVAFDRDLKLSEPWQVAPTQQRQEVIQFYVQHIDWAFAAKQYNTAVQWLNGADRKEAQAARKEALTQAALVAIPKHAEARDVDDDASEPPAAAAAAAAPAADATVDTKAAEPLAAAADLQTEPVVTLPADRATTEEAPASVVGEGTPLADGSVMFSLSNGATEYRKTDGTRVLVLADATQIFYDSEGAITIKVHADGTQEWPQQPGTDVVRTRLQPDGVYIYDYANNSSITMYPDGRSVTRYPDGTTSEVLPEATAA